MEFSLKTRLKNEEKHLKGNVEEEGREEVVETESIEN